jgi:PhnB protein
MNKRTPIEELDLTIDAILAGPRDAAPTVGARQATLVRVAADLRDLPSENFKVRLKSELREQAELLKQAELGGKTTMSTANVSTAAVNPVRRGFRTITPYLQVMQVEEVINFVKQAFGGEELFRSQGGAGGIHTEIKVGESMRMIGGGGTWKGPARPAGLLIYVDDADESYRRAMEAGATSIHEAVTQPYGDREGSVTDAAGNNWYITTRRVSEYAPAGYGDILLGFMPAGAAQFIDFLTAAFGAETIMRHDAPNGTVGHARIRIGDSIVMVSEPRGRYQPMPAGVYMYVENADEVYERAIRAGATSLYPVADMPYGDRMGGVTDAFGNEWYIATHFKDMPKK